MNELPLANRLCVVMARVVEAVNAHLDCAITLHMMNLQSPWNEFAGHFAANILLYTVGQVLFAACHSALIVIKLHIVGKERGKLLQIAMGLGVCTDNGRGKH